MGQAGRTGGERRVGGRAARALRQVGRLPAMGLVGLLRGYQIVFSPLRGPTCRYYPSCSAYAVTAVRRHGALRGTALASWRLLRCNPWSKGGVDHVPERGARLWQRQAAAGKGTGA